MHIEHLSHWSGHLNREMYLNRYGHGGIPVVVFASSGGSHNEYYDFGMIDACASFIEEGLVQFFTLSSLDSESWLATWKNAHDQVVFTTHVSLSVITTTMMLFTKTRQ
ncbi:esterase superfamily protein [Streptococcus pneumoniae]|nr:esterase superfamily protein [Streptococcus pneumoniae]